MRNNNKYMRQNKLFFKVLFVICTITIVGCKREVIFEKNPNINNTLKKIVIEFIQENNKNNSVVFTIKKRKIKDSLIFELKDINNFSDLILDSVFYSTKFLNTYIYSDFKNNSFSDYCDYEKAAKILNDIKSYEYYKKSNRVEILLDHGYVYLEILFIKNQFIKKEIKATSDLILVK